MEIIENTAGSKVPAPAAFIATDKDRSECGLQRFQLRTFGAQRANMLLDQRSRHDAGRCGSLGCGQQIADLRYAQSEIARPPDEGQPRHLLRVVGSASGVTTAWRSQQSDTFIETDCRWSAARFLRSDPYGVWQSEPSENSSCS